MSSFSRDSSTVVGLIQQSVVSPFHFKGSHFICLTHNPFLLINNYKFCKLKCGFNTHGLAITEMKSKSCNKGTEERLDKLGCITVYPF